MQHAVHLMAEHAHLKGTATSRKYKSGMKYETPKLQTLAIAALLLIPVIAWAQ